MSCFEDRDLLEKIVQLVGLRSLGALRSVNRRMRQNVAKFSGSCFIRYLVNNFSACVSLASQHRSGSDDLMADSSGAANCIVLQRMHYAVSGNEPCYRIRVHSLGIEGEFRLMQIESLVVSCLREFFQQELEKLHRLIQDADPPIEAARLVHPKPLEVTIFGERK